MKLEDRAWKEFNLSGENGIFKNYHGKRLTKEKRIDGNLPFLTAGEYNQGLGDFISNKDFITFKDFISIDMFGNAFYHEHICSGDDNIYFFINDELSKATKLFIVACINQNKSKYSYGKQFRQRNADTTKILLPISKNEEFKPDWAFMEEYIKEKYAIKEKTYKEHIKKVIKELTYKEIVPLEKKEWKEFFINELFDVIIGKNIDGNKVDKISGNIPYITRKESNNGLDGFIDEDICKLNNNFPVITIGNETAQPFVQNFSFFTGTKVNILIPKLKMSDKVLYFISTSLKQQKSKYNYTYTINSTRIKKQNILLPINENNEPDYEYMEQYMKNIMIKKYNKYLSYTKK
ncbi:restriction endonuclease subunit S [Methanococcus maripaludis]|uniref:Restriction enzyme BgcI subunit beta n=1 Tax=Methanococcus maripaludis TaxID=39152 RepID=A0A2L1CCY4_METMI|nr:restriction endonuclease [Methanococcus maripaludis]AVB77183.1 Restriction enzyme BgcI subunit beta [Methanococcus maripaludis]